MRIRATVAALSGALALSALAVPAAQADGRGTVSFDKPSLQERFGAPSAKTGFAAQAAPEVSNVTVNAGKALVFGTTTVRTFEVSLTASHPSGILDAYIDLWHGSDVENVDGYLPPNEEVADCTAISETTSNCKLTITASPGLNGDGVGELYANALAGTWHVSAYVWPMEGETYENDFYKTHKVQRLAKLTADAAPEPVNAGQTITVSGKLTRADWERATYVGLSGQALQLQFRGSDASAYTTVKGVNSTAGGAVKTTTTATVDGHHRFSFAGISSTGQVTATGDYVGVR
jgi:hypothetical protein